MTGASETDVPASTARLRRVTTAFVLLVWLATSFGLWSYVARFVSVLPFTDDVTMASSLLDEQRFSWTVLCYPHNEHRLPLPKFVYSLLAHETRDLRAGAWLQAGLISATSLVLLLASWRRRGRLTITDASIPLLVNSVADTENVLNSFQLAFSVPMFLAAVVLALALAWRRAPSWRGTACVWVLLVSLVASGGVALPFALAFAAWPAWTSWRAWRERAPGWRASVCASAAGGALLASALIAYLAGLVLLPGFHAPSVGRFLSVAAQFLITGVGVTSGLYWPLSAALLVLVALACWTAARALADPSRRAHALPLVCALAGALGLAAEVAWGRGNDGELAGFVDRYTLLSALGLCAVQLALADAGRAWSARIARGALLVVVVASLRVDVEYALDRGRERELVTTRFLERCRAGATIDELAHESFASFYYSERDFADALRAYQHGGYLPFLPFGDAFPPGVGPLDALRTRPTRITAAEPATARQLDRFPILLTRGAAEIEYAVPKGARHFSLIAGIAVSGPGAVVPLVIDARTADGRTLELARAELFQTTALGAVAWHHLELPLPAEPALEVRVRFERPDELAGRGWNALRSVRFRDDP